MAVELRWHEPDKILLTTYSGMVTAEELASSIEDIITGLETTTAPHLHVIVDWRQTTDYPYFVDLLPPARKLLRHARLGWIVIVGQNHTVKLWLDLFSGITDFRYKVVDKTEDAAQFLNTVVI
jgi:hypothetical protein